MHGILKLSLLSRYAVFASCAVLTIVFAGVSSPSSFSIALALAFAVLSLIGVYDLLQTRHAITRNYPIIGHVRFLVESVRPELRQYLFETDFEKLPFSRTERSLVYARSKNELDQRPFGTLVDSYATGHEFIGHSIRPDRR